MEAPKPTTSNNLKTFEYSNQQNGKKYNWKLITSFDSIEMNINEIHYYHFIIKIHILEMI